MKLHGLYIQQFGKLKDLKLTFQDGIHLIEGENEAGKSTLLRYFLWVFYGPVSLKEYGLNLREFSIPNGESYAFGRLEISIDDIDERHLTIERQSGTTRKEDFVRIFEKNTQNQVYYPEPLGKSFLGLSVQEFIKTLFMGSEKIPVFSSKNDGLFMKLSNFMDSGEEEVSYKKAIEEMNQKIKVLKSSKNSGQIPNIKSEIGLLIKELEDSKRKHQQKEALIRDLEQIAVEIATLEEQQSLLEELKHKARLLEKKEDIMMLKSSLDDLRKILCEKEKGWVPLSEKDSFLIRQKLEMLHSAEEDLYNFNIQYDALIRNLQLYSDYQEDQKLLDEITPDILMHLIQERQEEKIIDERLLKYQEAGNDTQPVISRKEEVLPLLKRYERQLKSLKPKTVHFRLSSSLSGLLLILSILKPAWHPWKAYYAVLPCLLFYSPPVQRKIRTQLLQKTKKTELEIERISHELGVLPRDVLQSKRRLLPKESSEEQATLKSRKEAIIKSRNYYLRYSGTTSLEELTTRLQTVRKNIEIHKEEKNKESLLEERIQLQKDRIILLKEDLALHLLPLGFDPQKQKVEVFWEEYGLNAMRISHLLEKESQLKLSIRGLLGDESLDTAIEELSTLEKLSLTEDITEEVLFKKEKDLSLEIQEKLQLRDKLTHECEKLHYRDPFYLEDYLNTKYEEELALHRKLSVLQKTREILMEAEEKVKKQYVETLGGEVSRRFESITGIKRNIYVEDLHAMKFEEGYHILEDQKLSHGALSQLYFSLRLTLIEKLFGQKSVPIFMDEVFSSFDDRRTENSLKLLKNEFSHNQILIFTSHKREQTLLENQAVHLTLHK